MSSKQSKQHHKHPPRGENIHKDYSREEGAGMDG